MPLLTNDEEIRLIKNAEASIEAVKAGGEPLDLKPVVKLFAPWDGVVFLISDYVPERRLFWGLGDLGQGFVVAGAIPRDNLEAVVGPDGQRIECDRTFKATKTIDEYLHEFSPIGRITV